MDMTEIYRLQKDLDFKIETIYRLESENATLRAQLHEAKGLLSEVAGSDSAYTASGRYHRIQVSLVLMDTIDKFVAKLDREQGETGT